MNGQADKRFLPQQVFLEQAMQELALTREQLASSLGASLRCFEKWMLPHHDPEYRDLEEAEWRGVRELLRAKIVHRAAELPLAETNNGA
ncbi:transcriptional regulator [Burkholderia vietnamiensis]|uniref:transcriptional regulator n=1 Tax=Burkholderia vietnamiensis TaxID=60552 RepID=UPI000A7BF19C|nr:transcriptional regulator [Burkholderia vietnamiensis]MBR8189202.1 transcriptional regulator [Burkholderia vietnamiensis]HDR9174409.1 transcriptional regulator [Burkholderia vietnamiensis]